jgi:hypothetical protein
MPTMNPDGFSKHTRYNAGAYTAPPHPTNHEQGTATVVALSAHAHAIGLQCNCQLTGVQLCNSLEGAVRAMSKVATTACVFW